MNDNPTQPAPAPVATAPEAKQAAMLARRRLLRGGLSVAPVLMASAPRSVMAGTSCTTASAFTSVALNASHAATMSTCTGKMPDYWKKSDPVKSYWDAGCLERNSSGNPMNTTKQFSTVFGSGYAGMTLMQVLEQPTASDNDELAKYVIAALLNARKGMTMGVLDEATVKTIWTKCSAGSYFEPTAGIHWWTKTSNSAASSGGCLAWLKSTMS
jgi:hypothetical protein